jgi:hypothetical protein
MTYVIVCVSFFGQEFLAWLYVSEKGKLIKLILMQFYLRWLARTYLPISQSHPVIGL